MKKLFLFLSLIFALSVSSIAQQAFTVQGGYSWTMGMVGVEYQYNYLAVGAGIMPTTMPGSGDAVTSFSAYLAWTDYKPTESGFYASIGFASDGYRSQYNYNNTGWTDDFTASMGIVNLGYKLQWFSGFNIKGEVGYGWCEYAKTVTYGVTAGWTFNVD